MNAVPPLHQLLQRSSGGQFQPLVAGCVSAHKAPKRSRGDDWSLWLAVVDETVREPPLLVTVFRPDARELPPVRQCGDVVLFSRLKVQPFGDKWQGVAYKTTPWALYHGRQGGGGPVEPYAISAPEHRQLFLAAEGVVLRLRQWQQQQLGGGGGALTTTVGRPLLELRDITRDLFFDCVGEVVDMQNYGGTTSVVAIADYTANTALRNINDRDGLSYQALNCTLWDNHAADLRRLGVTRGMFILLRNLRSKQSVALEAALHGDDRGGKVVILPDSDERVLKIKRRKAEWTATSAPVAAVKPARAPPPPPALRSERLTGGREKPAAAAAIAKAKSTLPQALPADKGDMVSISEILQNTSHPNKFRTTVQIIDYYPRDIRDFCRVFCSNCGTHSSALSTNRCSICSNYVSDFQFHFVLIIADKTAARGIPLLVHGRDVGCIFKTSIKPGNLYKSADTVVAIYRRLSELLAASSLEIGVGAFVVRDEAGKKVPTWRLLTAFKEIN